jgi:hypothetical protein
MPEARCESDASPAAESGKEEPVPAKKKVKEAKKAKKFKREKKEVVPHIGKPKR